MNPADLIPFFPERWRGTVSLVITLSLIGGRVAHSLANGRGLKGTLSAIWFGTNVPSDKSPAP